MAAKVAVAMLIALPVAKLLGGEIFGLSALALLVALSDTNGGMFLALTSAMGSEEDAGTYVPQSIETGPFLTMIILLGFGLANIKLLDLVAVVAPLFAGAILGNLDEDVREFFGARDSLIVPFMGFTLGQRINLGNVLDGGAQGIGLGVLVVVVTGTVCVLVDRLLGGSGVAGAAASSTAGNSTAVPQAVALADPSYAAIAPVATVQVAASVIVTAVLTPLLTAFVYRRLRARQAAANTAPPVSVATSPAVET
jgi:2-keto-3-deoxygluconate permease